MKRKSNNSAKNAFTLIEVLVATFILLVMVLILSKVFHQASVAWSAGFRRADGSMTGRSAVGFMARELMNSCADNRIFHDQSFGANTVQFITLAGEPNQYGGRVARQITYRYDSAERRVMRIEKWPDPNKYGEWKNPNPPPPGYVANGLCLVTNAIIEYSYPGSTPYLNGDMPEWVRIRLTINRSDDVSGVGAFSYGPDGLPGNVDDLKSW